MNMLKTERIVQAKFEKTQWVTLSLPKVWFVHGPPLLQDPMHLLLHLDNSGAELVWDDI